jgi:cell division septation protein DedD
VLAVAIAGAGFILQDSPANQPQRTASAELELLTEGIDSVEELQRSGQAFSSLLDDLATLTNKLAEDYAPNPEVKEKLPDLIQRQRALAESSPLDETVELAQQRLDEADQKVAAAAVAESPAAEPTSTTEVPAAVEETEEPTTEPTVEATPTLEIPEVALVSPSDLAPGVIAVQYDPNVTELGLRWLRVTTNTLTFVMPDSWRLRDVETDENGMAIFQLGYIFVETNVGADVLLGIDSATGGVLSSLDNPILRGDGPSGTIVEPAALNDLTGNDANVPALYYMLTTIDVVAPEAPPTETPSPTETSTPTATPTSTPTATATSEPDGDE